MTHALATFALALLVAPFAVVPASAQGTAPARTPVPAGESPAAAAPLARAGALVVERGWVRATRPGQPAAGGYVEVRNTGRDDDRLVAVRVDRAVAEVAELHTMRMDGDVMRMRAVDALAIPAGGRLVLRPGGDHLMLLNLRRTLATGQRVELTLRFERAGELKLELPVVASAPGNEAMPAHDQADHGHGHGHGGHGMPATR